MKCKHCGLDIPNDSNYCESCGKPVHNQPPHKKRLYRAYILLALVITATVVIITTTANTNDSKIIANLSSHPDGLGFNTPGNDANGDRNQDAANKKNDTPYKEVLPEIPILKNSKQGYDIIVGFFTSKEYANKCADHLKALGGDSYIISNSGGYYVSLGSAPTYTDAQAMEKHIKSWYKSDVAIKNFNE